MVELKNNYVINTQYSYTYWPTSSPNYLRYIVQVEGYNVKKTEKLSVLDLGCGQGLGVCILAAANPDCDIVGVDFNPEHIANGVELAQKAELKNAHFVEGSFSDLLLDKKFMKQRFDVIIIHGVYSWVDGDNRDALHQIIDQTTDDGAIIFVSYNTQPGRNQFKAIQELILLHADYNPKSNEDQAHEAIHFIEKIRRMNYKFFRDNHSGTEQVLTHANSAKGGYAVHEFLHRNQGSYFFHDVYDKFEKDKFAFISSTNLANNRIKFEKDEIEVSDSPRWTETLKDYYLSTQFRTDVFVKNPTKMSESEREDVLRAIPLMTRWAPQQTRFSLFGINNCDIKSAETLDLIVKLFENGIPTIGDIADLLKLELNFEQSLNWINRQIQNDNIEPRRLEQPDPSSAQRFNQTVLADEPFGKRYNFFAHPTTGNGIHAQRELAFLLSTLQENSPMSFMELLETLKQQAKNRPDMVEGLLSLTDPKDEVRSTAALATLAYKAVGQDIPHLRRLKILP